MIRQQRTNMWRRYKLFQRASHYASTQQRLHYSTTMSAPTATPITTNEASTTPGKRVCVLDCSHANTHEYEGELIKSYYDYWDKRLKYDVICDIHHIRTDIWPGQKQTEPSASKWNVDDVFKFISNTYDVAVISGSSDYVLEDTKHIYIRHLIELIQTMCKKDFKLVGICFGAQAIARALFGREALNRMPTHEYGYIQIHNQEGADPRYLKIFEEMACESQGERKLVQVVCHDDSIVWPALEKGEEWKAELLNWTNDCQVHAFRVKNCTLCLAVQYHPDFTSKQAEFIFEDEEKSGTPIHRQDFISEEALVYANRMFAKQVLSFL